jgi:hypothetical protein
MLFRACVICFRPCFATSTSAAFNCIHQSKEIVVWEYVYVDFYLRISDSYLFLTTSPSANHHKKQIKDKKGLSAHTSTSSAISSVPIHQYQYQYHQLSSLFIRDQRLIRHIPNAKYKYLQVPKKKKKSLSLRLRPLTTNR